MSFRIATAILRSGPETVLCCSDTKTDPFGELGAPMERAVTKGFDPAFIGYRSPAVPSVPFDLHPHPLWGEVAAHKPLMKAAYARSRFACLLGARGSKGGSGPDVRIAAAALKLTRLVNWGRGWNERGRKGYTPPSLVTVLQRSRVSRLIYTRTPSGERSQRTNPS